MLFLYAWLFDDSGYIFTCCHSLLQEEVLHSEAAWDSVEDKRWNVSRGHQRHTYFKEKKQQYSSLENIGSTFNNVKNKNIVQLQYFYRQSLFFNSVRINFNFNNNVNLWLGSQLSG